MKKLILLSCLALGACHQHTGGFRQGQETDATVQLDPNDKCTVWLSIIEEAPDMPRTRLRTHLDKPECGK